MSARNDFIKKYASDSKWFLALKEIRRPLLLNALSVHFDSENTEILKVLGDKNYNPAFVYPNLLQPQIETALSALVDLRQQVCQKESNKSIRQVYEARLTELIVEQELLLSVVARDFDSFRQYNVSLYGEMDKDLVAEQIHFLKKNTLLFDSLDVHTEPIANPTQSLFEGAKKLVTGPDIHVDLKKVYTSEEIKDLWNKELSEHMPGWQVMIDDRVFHMLVTHRSRVIKIPSDLKMKGNRMRRLFLHEIGTHVYRREQGKKNRLQLSSIGLSDTLYIEEGLAILRAQLASKKFWHYGGFDKHLTLAVATGMVDGEGKNFNETFRIMRNYYLDRLNRKKKSENIESIAQKRAWNSTVRVFRGGNPEQRGCCLLRDKIYYEGNRLVWKLLESNPEYFQYIMMGKFNPSDPVQLDLIIAGRQ